MRSARVFRRELDLWATAWRQVETFLERIDGARDSDDVHRGKLEALLRVAGVVERHRALADPSLALNPPVVDALPAQRWDPGTGSLVPTDVETSWSPDQRRWRVPGADELELAVAQLRTTGADDDEPKVLDEVRLARDRPIFTRAARVGDPPALLRLPAYPTGPSGSIAAGGRTVDVEPQPNDDGDTVSLFSQSRRLDAATAGLPGLEEDGEQDDEAPPDPVLAWSVLCIRRRLASRSGDVPVDPGAGTGSTGAAAGATATASVVVTGLRSGTLSAAAAAPLLLAVAAAARQAASSASPDVQTLQDAALVLDAAGCRTVTLPDLVRALAEALGGSSAGWLALASAADGLRLAPSSATARAAMDTAIAALTGAAPALLAAPVELGPLQLDLNDATGARIGYPDGTLRVLRTLEVGFAAGWSGWLRWFRLRYAGLLQPLADRSRVPFVAGVRALVNGGDTGLVYQGLTLGDQLTVGAVLVPTAEPASLALSLDELEPGTVGVLAGDRPAAVVVVGLDRQAGRLALNAAPLRVSMTPGGPGVPGIVPAGLPIGSVAAGLSDAELRLGESAAGAAADGPVQEAVGLWSRLCLVYGRDLMDAEIAGQQGLRTVPEPIATPLQTVTLHGAAPAYSTSLMLAGLPAAFWGVADGEPVPLLARPGELLLLRGRAAAEDGGDPGPLVQAVVEIERVVRTTASMLERMDVSTAAVLATDPAALPDPAAGPVPCLACGPDEDVAVVVLRRSWAATALVGEVSLRRDFAGFDVPSLATGRLLPLDLLTQVTGLDEGVLAGPAGVDRTDEFAAALEVFGSWTRNALTAAG